MLKIFTFNIYSDRIVRMKFTALWISFVMMTLFKYSSTSLILLSYL